MSETVDIHEEFAALTALRCLGRRRKVPRLEIVWSDDRRPFFGEAFLDDRAVRLHLFPGVDAAELRETMLHELVHLAPGCWHHRTAFKETLIEGASEAWDVDLHGAVGPASATFDIDRAIVRALRRPVIPDDAPSSWLQRLTASVNRFTQSDVWRSP